MTKVQFKNGQVAYRLTEKESNIHKSRSIIEMLRREDAEDKIYGGVDKYVLYKLGEDEYLYDLGSYCYRTSSGAYFDFIIEQMRHYQSINSYMFLSKERIQQVIDETALIGRAESFCNRTGKKLKEILINDIKADVLSNGYIETRFLEQLSVIILINNKKSYHVQCVDAD